MFCFSYIAATFVIEAMAAANALDMMKKPEKYREIKVNSPNHDEDSPLLHSGQDEHAANAYMYLNVNHFLLSDFSSPWRRL